VRITILGWGSLIWDQQALEVEGHWKTNGPMLPIEFARKSMDGRMTLVIHPNSHKLKTLWIKSSNINLNDAIANLREREKTNFTNIGYLTKNNKKRTRNEYILADLTEWLTILNLDAVIWTDLDSNIGLDEVIDYLNSITDHQIKTDVKNYIQRAPSGIKSKLRERLENIVENW